MVRLHDDARHRGTLEGTRECLQISHYSEIANRSVGLITWSFLSIHILSYLKSVVICFVFEAI